jgi:hypothetical protein
MVGAARGCAAGSVEFEHGDVVSGHVKWSVTTDKCPSAVQEIPGVVSFHSRPFFCCPPRLTMAHVRLLYATLPNRTVKVHFGRQAAEALARLSAVQNY